MYGYDNFDDEPWEELGARRDSRLTWPFRVLVWFIAILFVLLVGHSIAHGQTVNWFVDTTANLGGSATFTGTARDIGGGQPPPYVRFGCLFNTDQGGNGFVDSSIDGVTWTVAATAAIVANTPLDLDAPLRTRYVRCREVNGATPQTTNRVVSSLRG